MIDDTGILDSTGIIMRWEDLVSVSAYKVDAITSIITYIVFDHECGEYLEITDGNSIYELFIENLHKHLEIPSTWHEVLSDALPGDDAIEIWTR